MILRGHLSFLLILSSVTVFCEVLTTEESEEKKLRHKNNLLQANKGKYTTKEEIQKAPSDDHPCQLTQTSVEITFPDLKSETFVNFLGYKEPNLLYLMRCKGRCSENSLNHQIGCTPTKVREKKVKMIVKTQLSGRDPRERVKDMLLEEHVECDCQCKHLSSISCLGRFNNQTCECECEEKHYGKDRLRCELLKNTYWDTATCQCRSKSVSPRGVEQFPGSECGTGVVDPQLLDSLSSTPTKVEIVSLVLLGCFFTVSIFLAASTFYYRKKLGILSTKHTRPENGESKPKLKKLNLPSRLNRPKPATAVFAPILNDPRGIEDILVMNNTCDRYNEHGVKIENDYSDQELVHPSYR